LVIDFGHCKKYLEKSVWLSSCNKDPKARFHYQWLNLGGRDKQPANGYKTKRFWTVYSVAGVAWCWDLFLESQPQ
jgi:hypothetical protein